MRRMSGREGSGGWGAGLQRQQRDGDDGQNPDHGGPERAAAAASENPRLTSPAEAMILRRLAAPVRLAARLAIVMVVLTSMRCSSSDTVLLGGGLCTVRRLV